MDWAWMMVMSALAGLVSVVVVKRSFKALPTPVKLVIITVVGVVVLYIPQAAFNIDGMMSFVDTGVSWLNSSQLSAVGFAAGALVGMRLG